MNRYLEIFCILFVILLGSVIASSQINNPPVITLQYNPISWSTDQSLQTISGTYIPILSIDYNYQAKYFNNNNWVVVNVTPINNFSDPATIVFQKSLNSYVAVVGPSNDFPPGSLNNLPSDVYNYIK